MATLNAPIENAMAPEARSLTPNCKPRVRRKRSAAAINTNTLAMLAALVA
jgi:hypothetical protein